MTGFRHKRVAIPPSSHLPREGDRSFGLRASANGCPNAPRMARLLKKLRRSEHSECWISVHAARAATCHSPISCCCGPVERAPCKDRWPSGASATNSMELELVSAKNVRIANSAGGTLRNGGSSSPHYHGICGHYHGRHYGGCHFDYYGFYRRVNGGAGCLPTCGMVVWYLTWCQLVWFQAARRVGLLQGFALRVGPRADRSEPDNGFLVPE